MQISLFAVLLSLSQALPPVFELDGLLDRFLAPALPSEFFGDDDLTSFVGGGRIEAVPMSESEAMALLDSMDPFISRFSGFMSRIKPVLLDPFALFPGVIDRFDLPNVTISDAECLVTINLNGMDVNTTSIRVYSSDTDLSVEITNTQSMGPDEEEKEAGVTEEEFDLSNIEHLFNLRGSAVTSSFTTVRSFPAPAGCDLTSEGSKATIDEKGGNLLVKFPKLGLTAPETAAPVTEAAEGAEVEGGAIIRSALAVENSPSSAGWLRNLFGGKAKDLMPLKVPVPLVRYDEF